jgi:DNA helicase HerA-like ATPase
MLASDETEAHMSIEQIEQCETNREAALLATADAAQAKRVVLLWQQPTLADYEIPDALRIPPTLWQTLKSQGDSPPLFTIGRRLFVRTADLRSWLEEKARHGLPGSKRLRRAKREVA